MSAVEPELITIIEGPTPEFRITPQEWVQSIHEGPETDIVATTQLRTGNGNDILERCQRAWQERRPVKLDFPDEMRTRQRVNVLALRLNEVDEGPMLTLWVSLPAEFGAGDFDTDSFDDDGDDDGYSF